MFSGQSVYVLRPLHLGSRRLLVTTSPVPAEGGLFSPVVMRVIAIANDDEEKRFEPEVDAVAKNTDEDGNCDWKDHEQPDVIEHSDQLLMGHV
jgi:hypothetical protein